MKYKKIMIILVLTIFLFGVASVCASDMNDTIVSGEKSKTIELSQVDDDEKMSVEENELIERAENDEIINEGNNGTFAELQANVTSATSGSTLTLTKNYEYEDGFDSEGVLIDKAMTIDGQGHKIDAKGKSKIFKITADNVIVKNIIFINGKSGNGGAIYSEKSVTLINCNLSFDWKCQ